MSKKSKYTSSRVALSEQQRIEPAPEPRLDHPTDTRATVRRLMGILFGHPVAMIVVSVSCVASAILSVLGPSCIWGILSTPSRHRWKCV
ncbi:MAG: hypothetical protein ACLU8W_10570 [Clostridia bacterium]